MFPTLSLGPLAIPTFTLLIDLGLVGVLVWLWRRAPAYGCESTRWLDAGLCATAGAILGGRVAFASANWAYFGNRFFEVFKLWEGGYAWPGVVFGGVLSLLIYSRIKAEPVLPILDELSLPALLLSALGWVGCAAAACAAGKDVPPGSLPFAVNWPDLYGVLLPRWPTQIIGLGLSLIAFGYLLSQRDRRWPKGLRFSLALLFIALISFAVSNVRGDDMPLVSGWRLDVVTNAAMIAVGSIALVVAWAFEPAKESHREDAKDAKSAS
jgi:phosphatidylglycerol:prolipoprotein diacylglycerol transferase